MNTVEAFSFAKIYAYYND